MSEENVQIVKAIIAATESGDWERAIELFDSNVELDQSRMPDGGIYTGPSGVWTFYARWFGAWDDFRFESKGVIAAPGGRVVSLVRVSGRGKGSGVEVAMESADVFTFRNGKVIQMTGYPDRADALEAVGLSDLELR